MLQRVPKWSLRYVILVEAIYILYEVVYFRYPSHDNMNALALGLLLAALTMPSGAVLYYIAAYAESWLGYTGGEVKGFLPRMVTVQVAILLNAAFIAYVTRTGKAVKAGQD